MCTRVSLPGLIPELVDECLEVVGRDGAQHQVHV